MQEDSAGLSMHESAAGKKLAQTRLAVGLLQGVVLYFLYHSIQDKTWPATDRYVIAPLLLVAGFIPVIIVTGLGYLDRKRLWRWLTAATAIALALGFYDVWRVGTMPSGFVDPAAEKFANLPSALTVLFTGAGLFIAHALILAAVSDRRYIARYSSYFEIAWKLAIQVEFSALFVGVLWLILWLGSSLFMLVKLEFLQNLLEKPWFSIPVTAFAYSSALHITDVRPNIVRGIRTLVLVLNSWLLPLATLIVAGFLVSLPVTGLAPLWATQHATAVLLGSAAALVLLINAAFQNGEVGHQVAKILRASARLAAIMLVPIVIIAIYSLWLRVQQYGWTTDRVIAAACLLVASYYACGYGWAALMPGKWLSAVAPTNVITAFVILAVLMALFSPLADPARVSVSNQIARLESGKEVVSKFDFDYLRFSGARYGIDALGKLKVSMRGPDAALLRDKAASALKKQNRWERGSPVMSTKDVAVNITVWPSGTTLPDSFLNQDWRSSKEERWALPECLTLESKQCNAYLIDLTGDGKPEILLIGGENYRTRSAFFAQDKNGAWEVIGTLAGAYIGCMQKIEKALASGAYRVIPPALQDLDVGGQHLHIMPFNREEEKCVP